MSNNWNHLSISQSHGTTPTYVKSDNLDDFYTLEVCQVLICTNFKQFSVIVAADATCDEVKVYTSGILNYLLNMLPHVKNLIDWLTSSFAMLQISFSETSQNGQIPI